MSSSQTRSDLQAVAEALRDRDRFLLVTHENPDGDALGSVLALKLALDSLGKDSVMFLGGGGHRQAAGFSSGSSIAEIIDFIRREFAAASAA